MNYEEILQTVRGFCVREKLLDGKKHLALAVSGGADSMALLCLMRPLAEEKGIALTVCHVNHGLRGETADRDEAFVREVCARLGLPLRVFHAAELEAEAGKPRAGEDWARRLRYACFERVLADGIDAVATAHTGSDQAETLLFRLARGTGLHGAAGIRPSRPGYLRRGPTPRPSAAPAANAGSPTRPTTPTTTPATVCATAHCPPSAGSTAQPRAIWPASVRKPPRRTNTSPGRRMRCWLRPG